jgi:polysaccharide export outer membrane protein
VTGAVFQPGRILINDRPVARQAQQQTQQTGDYPTGRYLSAALKGAGGIRPDADIKCIRLIRQGKHQTIDL